METLQITPEVAATKSVAPSTTSNLTVVSIAEFCKANGFVQLAPAVRANTNGYTFITFINAKNEAENIYFSKSASSEVAAGQVIDKAMIQKYQVGKTTNAAGETRYKLIGTGSRLSIADLLS